MLRAAPRAAPPGADVALKVIAKKRLSRRAQHYLVREVAVHRAVSAHRHVASLHDVFEDAASVYLVQELLRGGDLYSALKRERVGLHEGVALRVAIQIVRALKYMHARGFAHRDVKPENIMFAERPCLRKGLVGTVKLVDFGLACARDPKLPVHERTSMEKCGTVRYAAPEILTDAAYVPERADMWSLGVVLYSMIAHRNPYTGRTEDEVVAQVDMGVPLFDGREWKGVSDATKHTIALCLKRQTDERPSAARCLALLFGALAELEGRSSLDGLDVEVADMAAAKGGAGRDGAGARRSADGESGEGLEGGNDVSVFSSQVTPERREGVGARENDGDGWSAGNLIDGLRALLSGGGNVERQRSG